MNGNQLQASLSRERAAVYCFSLLCAGYVIPSNSLKAKLCALLNTPHENKKMKTHCDSLNENQTFCFSFELEHLDIC